MNPQSKKSHASLRQRLRRSETQRIDEQDSQCASQWSEYISLLNYEKWLANLQLEDSLHRWRSIVNTKGFGGGVQWLISICSTG